MSSGTFSYFGSRTSPLRDLCNWRSAYDPGNPENEEGPKRLFIRKCVFSHSTFGNEFLQLSFSVTSNKSFTTSLSVDHQEALQEAIIDSFELAINLECSPEIINISIFVIFQKSIWRIDSIDQANDEKRYNTNKSFERYWHFRLFCSNSRRVFLPN